MIEPKEYVLSVFCANEWFDEAPDRARVTITKEKAERIVALAKLVRDNKLWCVEEWDYLPEYGHTDCDADENGNELIDWDTEGEFRTEADRMIVFKDEVQWECYPKHVDNADMSTEQIKVKELAELFDISFED